MPYTPDPNDVTQPQGNVDASTAATEFRSLKSKIASMISGLFTTTAVNTNPYGLVNLLHPSVYDFGKEVIASGWDFCGRNQQWGGAPSFYHLVDSATGVQYKFESFDGYIEDSGDSGNIGQAAGNFYAYQVMIPPKNLSLAEIWWKGFKSGNPVDNLTLQLYSVAAGIPNALIATANVINGKQITSDVNGQWYRFAFAVVQALIAGTQYMIVMSKSGGVDAANFYIWKTKATTKYPNNLRGVGTVVPAWTPANTLSQMFIAVAQASDQIHQSGGQFENKLVGYDATPINRGGALCQDLKNLKWNPKKGTVLIRGSSFTKGKPIFDALYGLHHDRLVLYTDTISGVGKVSLFQQNGTVNTVIGTTDLSTITFKDISIEYSINGNGGDYLRLRVGTGAVAPTVEASLTAQTFVIDPLWGQLGTAWLMGGFDPTFTSASYTKLSNMNVLPSADGWTFTTTVATVEGNVFAISGGKLNQIKSGMAAGGDGYYNIAASGVVNANGGFVCAKYKIVNHPNTKDSGAINLAYGDGAKAYQIVSQEYYLGTADAVTHNAYPQADLKSVENVIFLMGKASDQFAFINGKLVADDTSRNLTASVFGAVRFGDLDTTANENTDVLYDYVGYYNTAWKPPQFSSCSISEFAYWQEDAAAIMTALYNAGAPLSVKSYTGIKTNWVESQTQNKTIILIGITASPTTTSSTPSVIPEMECFSVGSVTKFIFEHTKLNSFVGTPIDSQYIYQDGMQLTNHIVHSPATNLSDTTAELAEKSSYFGLHKNEIKFSTNAGTLTSNGGQFGRTLTVESKI